MDPSQNRTTSGNAQALKCEYLTNQHYPSVSSVCWNRNLWPQTFSALQKLQSCSWWRKRHELRPKAASTRHFSHTVTLSGLLKPHLLSSTNLQTLISCKQTERLSDSSKALEVNQQSKQIRHGLCSRSVNRPNEKWKTLCRAVGGWSNQHHMKS